MNRDKQGLDLNRNFPVGLAPGVRAAGRGALSHLRAGGARGGRLHRAATPTSARGVSFHTHSGVILRPFSSEPDDEMHAEDLWLYKLFGKKSTELTGYPNISIFHDFKYHPKQVITGGFDWIYEHLGQFFWTVEIWAPVQRGGHRGLPLHRLVPRASARGRPEAAALERPRAGRRGLRRVVSVRPSAAGPGRAGRLEQARRLPQPAGEVPRARGEALPRVARRGRRSRCRGSSCMQAEADAPGRGHAGRCASRCRTPATCRRYVTKRALERKVVRGVVYEIELPRARRSSRGKARVEGGQLEGRASKASLQAFLPEPASSPAIAGSANGPCAPPAGTRRRPVARATIAPAACAARRRAR